MASEKRGMLSVCLFCRTPFPADNASELAMVRKRVDAKDPEALRFLGNFYNTGMLGIEKNLPRAHELWTEAAELGSIRAQESLGHQYFNGEGVTRDETKAVQCWEKAAMQGQVQARHNLGHYERGNGNYERAVRHYMITSKMGDEVSLNCITDMFMRGTATTEQYAEAIKGYQVAVEEMRSPNRDEAQAMLSQGM